MSTFRGQREQARVWHDPNIEGIELLYATFITHTFPKHAHESYGIGLSNQGAGIIQCHGTKHIAPPSHLIFFHPGEVHSGHADEKGAWTYQMIYLDVDLVVSALDGYSATLSFPKTTFQNLSVAASFSHLHKAFSKPASILERETLLQKFLNLLRQRACSSPATQRVYGERPAVRLVREYLEENYHKNVSIKTLAALTGLSPNYLVTAFRSEVGLPPHCYQMQVRVRHAKEDLYTHKSLTQVALDIGFYDQSHFNRWFKRLVGVTPKSYRDSSFIQDR